MAKGRFENPIVAALAGFKDIFRKQDLSSKLVTLPDASSRNILITGANSGLGFGLAVDLVQRNAQVTMACRREIPEAGDKVKKITGKSNVSMRHLDLSSVSSIYQFVQTCVDDNVTYDVVILNAGVALPKARKTESGLEEMFFVNYLSNVILTNLLIEKGVIDIDQQKPRSRIIFVSSDSHQGSSFIDYDEFGIYKEYGPSKGISYYSYYKLVLNTYATALSARINNGALKTGVHVICPGPVNTNIIKEAPFVLKVILGSIFTIIFKSPKQAALPLTYMALHEDFDSSTNQYLHMFNQKLMDEKVYLKEEGDKLWEASITLWKQIDPKAKAFND